MTEIRSDLIGPGIYSAHVVGCRYSEVHFLSENWKSRPFSNVGRFVFVVVHTMIPRIGSLQGTFMDCDDGRRRKGLKRSVNREETQKHHEVLQRTNTKSSQLISVFMPDKHPLVRVSPYARSEKKKKHKSIKDSGPSCPLHLISASCGLSCAWPHSCCETFYLGFFFSGGRSFQIQEIYLMRIVTCLSQILVKNVAYRNTDV